MDTNNRFAGIAKAYHLFEEFIDENDVLLQKEMGRLIRELCPQQVSGPIPVFEAGCGIGSTSFEILASNKNIVLHSIDLDPGMVEITQKSLEHFIPTRLNVTVADVSDALRKSGKIAMFISALTLHNIAPRDKRLDVLAWVYSKLTPGGVFIDGDKIADSRGNNYWERYESRIRKIGLLIQYGYREQAEFWQAHEREDRLNVLHSDEYIEILRSIGFVGITIRKELGLYKIVTAFKR